MMSNPLGALAALALATVAGLGQPLPGTAPLTEQGDLAARMVEGIHRYLDRETAAAPGRRSRPREPEQSRRRFAKMIGAVDARVSAPRLRYDSHTPVASAPGYRTYAVSWQVFESVEAEGLLLEPDSPPVARVVAIPDADWSPEMAAGLAPGVPPAAQFVRRLAENGCQVLAPVLIDRRDTWSGIPWVRMTNQPHREWIYRMAFEVGRHVIGYEVQKVLAAVDWFERENGRGSAPVAVAGHGEGGLLALYSAALDSRIRAALVSGYFQGGREIWREPVYRDVWGLEREFGDAEIAALVAPRPLVIEAARAPEISGPPPRTKERANATPNGALVTPGLDSVEVEVKRARGFYSDQNAGTHVRLAVSGDGRGEPGSDAALAALLEALGIKGKLRPARGAVKDGRDGYDPEPRMRRQFDQLVAHSQKLVAESPRTRARFWSKADSSTPARWQETTRFYRDYIWDEVIGRMPPPSLPANPRARLVFDEPKFRGYEVMLDVWPDVFAYGILLLPKDIKLGERRPVVVCQHGLEGRPQHVADPAVDNPAYHRYAVQLAEEGFITFAPQNPYIGEDRFRLIQRKGHPLKLALFSFILGQHQRLLEWLAAQPYVDPSRIGFYGLSYGGKTAVRVPPLLDGYALSICSADFNEWVWKTTSVDSRYSYMVTREYDMYEFDFANIVNYAELANLMAPRPFMVERGHHDGVAPDEWVAYEFAKVRFFYDTRMNLPDHAALEFFNGPHSINGQGTFEFLRRHLKHSRQAPVASRQ
jgi:dienelactone hydrolase